MGYLNSGIGAARINDSSPSDYTTYSGNKIETKQNSTDNTLTTTSKTIVGAINEVNSKVNNKFIVAQTLPVSDIDEFAIYLVPKSTAQINNIYDEYIYISTDTPAHWEKIGDTEIDLSGYYTSGQVDNLLSDKQDATDNSLATTDKTVVGAINELNGRFDYSTTEKAVGTWVDGKTIYKKTIYIASMPDGSTTESEYLIGDFLVDMVVDYSSTLFIDDKSQFLPMPYIFTTLNTAYIQLGFKNKNNKFYVGIRSAGLDRSGARGYVTAYYTKQ